MKKITADDLKNFFRNDLRNFFYKLWYTPRKIKIIFIVLLLCIIGASCYGYFYAKSYFMRKDITKKAQELVTTIAKNQTKFFEKNGRYNKEYFKSQSGKSGGKEKSSFSSKSSSRYTSKSTSKKGGRRGGMDFDSDEDSEESFRAGRDSGESFSSGRRGGSSSKGKKTTSYVDFSAKQNGDFYIEVDADNGCMVLKYKRNTIQKTTFYASFKEGKAFCLGKNCLEEAQPDQGTVCYREGLCSLPSLVEETQRSCGNGHGIQKRNCVPSCYGGRCEVWSECICERGFGWNGTTCTQLQTEKDCSEEQCFNGIYCENKDELEKDIENGSCVRYASCQKNSGWKYSSWECACPNEDLCALKETCVPRPEGLESLTLDDQQGSCTGISYTCQEGKGWQPVAEQCSCEKIGTFWDNNKGFALCSDCTKKPANSHFTSIGKDKDNCSWQCDEGYQERKGKCLKPDGKYLCIGMNPQICTDEFSKERKMKKDTQTNEGTPCYVEDKDNILFFSTKTQKCQICQCVNVYGGTSSN